MEAVRELAGCAAAALMPYLSGLRVWYSDEGNFVAHVVLFYADDGRRILKKYLPYHHQIFACFQAVFGTPDVGFSAALESKRIDIRAGSAKNGYQWP